MANFTSFVTEYYLKQFTPISANMDVSEIIPQLEVIELINTRELVGRPLYEDLKAKFIAQTLNTDEEELVLLLKRGIAYRAASEALVYGSMKITAKGAQKLRGDYSDPIDLPSLKYLKEDLVAKANYFDERVVEYLCKNSKLFPLYNDTDNIENITPTLETRYDNDIVLDEDIDWRLYKKYYGPSN